MWGSVSDERTGLSFTIAAGPRHRSHSRVRVQWHSRPYFTVSDSRLSFTSPPTTLRATVEVFYPRLHTGFWVTLRLTVSQSGAHDQILVTFDNFCFVRGGGALSDERVGLSLTRDWSILPFHYILSTWHDTDRIEKTSFNSSSVVGLYSLPWERFTEPSLSNVRGGHSNVIS
jgi:hypothetical protein